MLKNACKTNSINIKRKISTVFESTVYPGMTEEICSKVIENIQTLNGKRFYLGYSPERINPGDKIHKLENITKVISVMTIKHFNF